jgi:arylsulfatase
VFNLKADPFESYSDELGAAGHLAQQISWITSPMREILRDHLMTLGKYPPVQGSKSLSMANIVEEFLDRNHD